MPTDKKPVAVKGIHPNRRKLKRAQRLLGTATENETVDRALDEVISEHERNREAWEANERFLASGIQVRDVFERLAR
jgi:hypothetical protein